MKLRILISVALAWCVAIGWGKGKTTTKLPDCYDFLRGVEAYQEGKDQEALHWMKKEVSEHAYNGYAYLYISMIRREYKEYEKALTAINEALRFIPKKDKQYRGNAYGVRGDIYLGMKDTVSALKEIDLAIIENPEDPQYYRRRAQIYMEQERYEEALDQVNHAIKLAPDYSAGYYLRGVYYSSEKRYPEAIDDFIKTLSISRIRNAIQQLTTMDNEAFPLIRAKLQEQIAKNPDEWKWYDYMGQVLESNNRPDEAIEYYEQAYTRKGNAYFLNHISGCYLELGNFDAALDYIDRAISMDRNDYNFVLQKGKIYNEMGKSQEALAELDKYVTENPNKYWGYYYRGRIKDKANDTKRAIEDYSMAIALEPEYTYSYLGRGRMYNKLGEEALASADFQKIIEMDTEANPGKSCAQFAYYFLGQNDKAIEYTERLIAKDEGRAYSYFDAACLYSLMNDKETGVNYLRKAIEHGFRRIDVIEADTDLDNIRDMAEYRELCSEFF